MEDRIDLVDGAFWGRNPPDELAWLRRNAPVWRDPRHGVWGVATYDLVKQVSSQPKLFSNAGGIVMESLLILIGGDETTRHVISGGAYQLLAERDRWEALVEDPGLLGSAIEEMLRWVSPIKNMARTATRDVELGGQKIPAGDKLLLLYPSANRDEAVFDDPSTFDIRRAPNEHLAFGFGTHFCLGNSLARLELRVVFSELLARLPGLELAGPAEPAYRPANFVSGYESLPVRFGRAARRTGR